MSEPWRFSSSPEEDGPRAPSLPPRRPIVVVNPGSDLQFRQMVDRSVANGGRSPDDLEAALRTRYPAAVVRPRELAGERFDVWYVYRDGHWIRSEADVGAR